MTIAEGIKTIDDNFYSKADESLGILGFRKGTENKYPEFVSTSSLKEEMDKMWQEGDNFAKYYRNKYSDGGQILEVYISSNFVLLEKYSLSKIGQFVPLPSTVTNFLRKSYIEGIKKSYETKIIDIKPKQQKDSIAMVS